MQNDTKHEIYCVILFNSKKEQPLKLDIAHFSMGPILMQMLFKWKYSNIVSECAIIPLFNLRLFEVVKCTFKKKDIDTYIFQDCQNVI